MNATVSLALFAQQAYNTGYLLGRIVGYVVVGILVLWVLSKLLRR
jgi:hypothetical protein